MLSVLSALGGILASFLPEVVKYFKDRSDKAHELAVLNLQIERDKAGFAQRIEEVRVNADVAETQTVYQFANPKEGFVASLNAAIRPFVTILLVCGYIYSKFPKVSWDETDMALLSGVMGFWFGNRSIREYLGNARGTLAWPGAKK